MDQKGANTRAPHEISIVWDALMENIRDQHGNSGEFGFFIRENAVPPAKESEMPISHIFVPVAAHEEPSCVLLTDTDLIGRDFVGLAGMKEKQVTQKAFKALNPVRKSDPDTPTPPRRRVSLRDALEALTPSTPSVVPLYHVPLRPRAIWRDGALYTMQTTTMTAADYLLPRVLTVPALDAPAPLASLSQSLALPVPKIGTAEYPTEPVVIDYSAVKPTHPRLPRLMQRLSLTMTPAALDHAAKYIQAIKDAVTVDKLVEMHSVSPHVASRYRSTLVYALAIEVLQATMKAPGTSTDEFAETAFVKIFSLVDDCRAVTRDEVAFRTSTIVDIINKLHNTNTPDIVARITAAAIAQAPEVAGSLISDTTPFVRNAVHSKDSTLLAAVLDAALQTKTLPDIVDRVFHSLEGVTVDLMESVTTALNECLTRCPPAIIRKMYDTYSGIMAAASTQPPSDAICLILGAILDSIVVTQSTALVYLDQLSTLPLPTPTPPRPSPLYLLRAISCFTELATVTGDPTQPPPRPTTSVSTEGWGVDPFTSRQLVDLSMFGLVTGPVDLFIDALLATPAGRLSIARRGLLSTPANPDLLARRVLALAASPTVLTATLSHHTTIVINTLADALTAPVPDPTIVPAVAAVAAQLTTVIPTSTIPALGLLTAAINARATGVGGLDGPIDDIIVHCTLATQPIAHAGDLGKAIVHLTWPQLVALGSVVDDTGKATPTATPTPIPGGILAGMALAGRIPLDTITTRTPPTDPHAAEVDRIATLTPETLPGIISGAGQGDLPLILKSGTTLTPQAIMAAVTTDSYTPAAGRALSAAYLHGIKHAEGRKALDVAVSEGVAPALPNPTLSADGIEEGLAAVTALGRIATLMNLPCATKLGTFRPTEGEGDRLRTPYPLQYVIAFAVEAGKRDRAGYPPMLQGNVKQLHSMTTKTIVDLVTALPLVTKRGVATAQCSTTLGRLGALSHLDCGAIWTAVADCMITLMSQNRGSVKKTASMSDVAFMAYTTLGCSLMSSPHVVWGHTTDRLLTGYYSLANSARQSHHALPVLACAIRTYEGYSNHTAAVDGTLGDAIGGLRPGLQGRLASLLGVADHELFTGLYRQGARKKFTGKV